MILAWIDDPGHPLSTAERLHELINDSELHVASTPADLDRPSDDLLNRLATELEKYAS